MTEAVATAGDGEAGSTKPATRTPGLGGYGTLAVVFIFVTLIALVVVPLLVNQRVVRLREEIEASEPARTMTNQLQFSLVRQMSSLSELPWSPSSRRGRRKRRSIPSWESWYTSWALESRSDTGGC